MDAEGEIDPDYARGSQALPFTPSFSQLAREDVEMDYGETVPSHIGRLVSGVS